MLRKQIRRHRLFLSRCHAAEVELGLSEKERRCLARFQIETELPQFDFFGSSHTLLARALGRYLQNAGCNTSLDLRCAAQIVTRIAKGALEGFAAESVWVMVRITLPNADYAVPRWHPDGRYFTSFRRQYKLVTALKGAPTLFGEVRDRAKIEELTQADQENQVGSRNFAEKEIEDLRIRRALSDVVTPRVFGGAGRAVLYLVGHRDAVFHSEPNMKEARLFVAILPGTRKQIRQWQRQLGYSPHRELQ